jgi:hypothetical protein
MIKVDIFHFRELEKYPPILNLLSYSEKQGLKLKCFSGRYYGKNKLIILTDYCLFTIRSFCFILFSKSKNILYFESISSIPVYLLFLVLPYSKKKLFIHYHEFFDKNEYRKQSFFERLGRILEIKLLKKAIWISHTNKDRMVHFHQEFPDIDKRFLRILPNYPPSSWLKASNQVRIKNNNLINLVYIGSLSDKGMYLENLLEMVGNNPRFTVDFYSHKFTDEVTKIISKYSNCYIKGAIAYKDIPKLKGFYDIGLVLYKGLSINFKYNAPNKIFEYLALDLDVWCSDKLITAREYERLDFFPKMIMVDYENLKHFNLEMAINRDGLTYKPSEYVCESVYEQLINVISEDSCI